MADERDLELLDDYLANRMVEQDRDAFERKLEADPDLRQEYAVQQRLVKGIRDARVAELKAMLNNVPVPQGTGNAVGTKIVLGAVVTLMIAAAAYWFISRQDMQPPAQQTVEEKPAPVAPPEQSPREGTEEAVEEESTVEQDKNQTSAGTEHSRPSLARKPDPLPGPQPADRPAGASGLVVETNGEHDRYRFDYRLSGNTLSLFGPFAVSNYEVIRYPEGTASVPFLHYKNTWYRLEQTGAEIKPLVAVTDQEAIRKLDAYRAQP